MPINRVLSNAAGLLRARPFRLEQGQCGTKLVATGAWDPSIPAYMRAHDILELELNYVKGFKHHGSKPDFLSELVNLQGIEISYAPFTDLSEINQLSELRYLCMGLSRAVRGLEIDRLVRLENLALEWFNGAEGLFALEQLRALTLILYPGNHGSKPFRAVRQLRELRLSECGLAEIENLGVMTKLERLELLAMKRLRSLNGIECLFNLRKLRIERCKAIESTKAVAELTELRYLSFSNCGKIESVAPLRKLKRLEILHFFEGTEVLDSDLSVLRELPCLQDVRFQNRRSYNVRREEFPPFGRSVA